jgi:hypothetical protein
MEYLIALLAALGLGFIFERNKAKEAEAVTENNDTVKQVNNLDASVQKDKALADAESQKRDDIKKEMDNEKANKESLDQLADFLNSRK